MPDPAHYQFGDNDAVSLNDDLAAQGGSEGGERADPVVRMNCFHPTVYLTEHRCGSLSPDPRESGAEIFDLH